MSSSLSDALSQYMDANGGGDGLFITPIAGLGLMRASTESLPNPMIYRPALCVVAQGAKSIMLGEEVLEHREMQSLVVSVELPAIGKVIRASADQPFLAISLEFDAGVIRQVMDQLDDPPKPNVDSSLGAYVDHLDGPLADCVLRLIRLLGTPKAIPVIYPLLMREIYFWLLTGTNGDKVCAIALPNSHAQRVTEAIYLLRDDFTRSIRIEELAAAAKMSTSSFHQHFKTLTSMTPLQYQKHLRLLEARRLMLTEDANVMRAAYHVGYESPSQFSREYTRMFGMSPKRHAAEARKLYQPDELSALLASSTVTPRTAEVVVDSSDP
jgi:AraC-like DNA-binding protein